MKAVILAAARSEKLLPFTETRAKPMIRVAGRTILEYMATALREAGVVDLLVVVNHKREGIQRYFEHGHNFGLNIEYVVQEPIDGIGAGLRRCEPELNGEPFLLVYGDVLATGQPFTNVLQQFSESGSAVAALSLPPSSSEFGNVYLDNDMRITRLVEKPSDPHLSNYVFAGIYLLPPTLFRVLDQCQHDIEQAFQALIRDGQFHGTLWEGGWIDVRRPWQILEANRMVMDLWHTAEIDATARLEGNVRIEGAVHIEGDVVVGSGSILKGPCYVGRGSYIGNNTLIREYSSLGPDSVVGYGTELKNCVLFGRSTLGRLSFIGDSVIGEGVQLGSGLTTVNVHSDWRHVTMQTEEGPISTGMSKIGAFIGDDAYIGARHVLSPGTRIKAGAFVDDAVTQPSLL
jgi:UDP-N-acetylglucosamine diphosphorylase / glucose-1-phosphate thymidylyltransferase / UDP-N-acetylgalactosamine diphosphorylase / glucosamine-1-phosphate N-acetyltransferase / galactosamine-1-phosphate N-acetyltransferase